MKFNKKAISPVVATALLLVVAVVAVVGFQTWFNTYQSSLNTKVEQQSAAGSAITIERLESDGTTYLKNGGIDAVTATSVKAGTCTNTSSLPSLTGKNITTITQTSCSLTPGSAYDVLVVTDGGVFQANLLAR